MPQRKCAAKRLRVDKTKKLHKSSLKAEIKKEVKGLRSLITDGKLDEAKEKLKVVYAKLDKAVTKGLLHKNTAARRKSNLALKVNAGKR